MRLLFYINCHNITIAKPWAYFCGLYKCRAWQSKKPNSWSGINFSLSVFAWAHAQPFYIKVFLPFNPHPLKRLFMELWGCLPSCRGHLLHWFIAVFWLLKEFSWPNNCICLYHWSWHTCQLTYTLYLARTCTSPGLHFSAFLCDWSTSNTGKLIADNGYWIVDI